MRLRSKTTSFLIGLSTLAALEGCGSEGIDAPVPSFDVPSSMDSVAGQFVTQSFEQLQNNPKSMETWKLFAASCLANEMFVDAVGAYEVIMAYAKSDAESIWRCAIAHSELGELQKAIDLAEQHFDLFRCRAECSRRLARWHYENGQLEAAKLRLADRSSCGFEDYWMDQLEAEICISEGDFEKAKTIIQRYPIPMEDDLLRLAKLTAQRLGDDSWNESLSQSKGRETRIPPDPWIDDLAPLNRLLLADRRRAEALVSRQPTKSTTKQLRYLHELRPQEPWFAATYAMNLLQSGQTEKASEVLAGCTLEREQWTTEFWMVTALIRMKQYEATPSDAAAQSVLQACRNVLEVDPNHYTATKTSAQAHRLLGDYNAEKECWQQASELAETDSERLNCLGASLQAVGRSGDWVQASSSFDILLEDIPPEKATPLWAAAAEAAIKAGRSDRANFYLERLRSAGFEDIVSQLKNIKVPS